MLRYFSSVFDGLCKLCADVDVDVKNGAKQIMITKFKRMQI